MYNNVFVHLGNRLLHIYEEIKYNIYIKKLNLQVS